MKIQTNKQTIRCD